MICPTEEGQKDKLLEGTNGTTQPRAPPDKDGSASSFLFFKHVMLAAVSSIITETIVAPLERVKLIMQVQALQNKYTTKSGKTVFVPKGFISSYKKLIAKQGVLSLWRGYSANVYYTLPNHSFTFALKDKIVTIITSETGIPFYCETPFRAMIIGCVGGVVAGCLMQLVVYPMDFARTTLATDVHKNGRKTIFSVLSKTYKAFGINGLYRGISLSMVGVGIYRCCYFGIYDFGVKLTPIEHRETIHGRVLPAFLGVAIGGFLSYPIDTIRRTVMIRRPRKSHDDIVHAAKRIYRRSGVKGYYYGSVANLIRSVAGTIMLVTYNTIKAYT